MKLIEAILSGKPFRRPSWVYDSEIDPDQWVVLAEDKLFDWADAEGKSTGDVFSSLEGIVRNNGEVEDYEIKE